MSELYITIGAPGCGKSTKSAQIAAENPKLVILNADELRGLYGCGEWDQTVSAQAFDFIQKAANVLFRQGFSVLVDVTSKDKRARAEFLSIAAKYKARTIALCFDTPLAVCQARNAARSRVVPADVVSRIFSQIVWPVAGEFDEIRHISHLQKP